MMINILTRKYQVKKTIMLQTNKPIQILMEERMTTTPFILHTIRHKIEKLLRDLTVAPDIGEYPGNLFSSSSSFLFYHPQPLVESGIMTVAT